MELKPGNPLVCFLLLIKAGNSLPAWLQENLWCHRSSGLGSRLTWWCQLKPFARPQRCWPGSTPVTGLYFTGAKAQGMKGQKKKPPHTDKQLFWQHWECSKSRVQSTGVLARGCFYAPGFSHHTCVPKMEKTDGPRSLCPATLPCSAGHFDRCLTLSLYLNSADLDRT